MFQCLNCKQQFLLQFHPGFQIKVPQMTIHSDLLHVQLKQLNSMEIFLYFIFKTIKCDRSTWLAGWKVDQSPPKSVRTLSVDRPLFRALPDIPRPGNPWQEKIWRPGNSAWNWGSVNPGYLKRCIKLLAEAWELGKTVYTTDKWDCTVQNIIVQCSALLVY